MLHRLHSPIFRIISLMNEHVYSCDRLTHFQRFRFRIYSFASFFLMKSMARLFDEIQLTNETKHILRAIYTKDIVDTMHEFADRYRIPWKYTSEEDFEASFDCFKLVQQQLHNRVPLKEAETRNIIQELLKIFLPVRSKPSGYTNWNYLEYSNIILSQCLFTDNIPKDWENVTPGLIRVLKSKEFFHRFIYECENGSILLKCGKDFKDPIILCLCLQHMESEHIPTKNWKGGQ